MFSNIIEQTEKTNLLVKIKYLIHTKKLFKNRQEKKREDFLWCEKDFYKTFILTKKIVNYETVEFRKPQKSQRARLSFWFLNLHTFFVAFTSNENVLKFRSKIWPRFISLIFRKYSIGSTFFFFIVNFLNLIMSNLDTVICSCLLMQFLIDECQILLQISWIVEKRKFEKLIIVSIKKFNNVEHAWQ